MIREEKRREEKREGNVRHLSILCTFPFAVRRTRSMGENSFGSEIDVSLQLIMSPRCIGREDEEAEGFAEEDEDIVVMFFCFKRKKLIINGKVVVMFFFYFLLINMIMLWPE
jgi:hypothetical protein